MAKKKIPNKSSSSSGSPHGCMPGSSCTVEAVLSVDERGQMVLPKELRDKANIRAGDKLAIVSWDRGGEICCLYLIKTEYLAERVKEFLGPMIKEMKPI